MSWIATRKIARCREAVPSHTCTFQVFLFSMLQTAAGGSSARRHQKAPAIQSVACGGHPRQASLHVAPGTKTLKRSSETETVMIGSVRKS